MKMIPTVLIVPPSTSFDKWIPVSFTGIFAEVTFTKTIWVQTHRAERRATIRLSWAKAVHHLDDTRYQYINKHGDVAQILGIVVSVRYEDLYPEHRSGWAGPGVYAACEMKEAYVNKFVSAHRKGGVYSYTGVRTGDAQYIGYFDNMSNIYRAVDERLANEVSYGDLSVLQKT